MFFCEPCKERHRWPMAWHGLFASHGPCEVCGTVADCYEVPSMHLPEPEKFLTERQVIEGET